MLSGLPVETVVVTLQQLPLVLAQPRMSQPTLAMLLSTVAMAQAVAHWGLAVAVVAVLAMRRQAATHLVQAMALAARVETQAAGRVETVRPILQPHQLAEPSPVALQVAGL